MASDSTEREDRLGLLVCADSDEAAADALRKLPEQSGVLTTGARQYLLDEIPIDESFTGELALAASAADAAVILVDPDAGVSPAIRRLSYVASLMGVRSIVVAAEPEAGPQIREMLSPLGLSGVAIEPLSALLPWLETCPVRENIFGAENDAETDLSNQADHFAAHMLWLANEPLYPERSYTAKIGGGEQTARITGIKHRIDLDSLDELAARDLRRNEFAYVNIAFDEPVPFERDSGSTSSGRFILIDRITGATVGGGLLDFALWRSSTVSWHSHEVDKQARTARIGQRPAILWLTGLSGSGKSTIVNALEKRLHAEGRQTYLLDGDNLRHGLNRDLGFLPEDRVENIRRVGEVAKLFVDSGTIVLAALISPFENERQMVRDMVEPGEFIEIFVDTPLEECERRDPKGLYRRARSGELRNFTGIDSPYEPPAKADLVLDTVDREPESLADDIYGLLVERGLV
jgi:adenylyl-sulfate kinase